VDRHWHDEAGNVINAERVTSCFRWPALDYSGRQQRIYCLPSAVWCLIDGDALERFSLRFGHALAWMSGHR